MNHLSSFKLKSCWHHLAKKAGQLKGWAVAGAMALAGTASAQYCVPTSFSTYSSCTGGSIINVTFATINRSTPCVISTTPSDYYKDLTTVVAPAQIELGSTYAISVEHSIGWAGAAAVWIDFNRNQQFESNEKVAVSSSTAIGGILTANVTVPANATPGASRMRVMALESGIPSDPCSPGGWAEVEDYAIIIGSRAYNNAAVSDYTPIAPFCSGPSVTRDVYVRVANRGANNLVYVGVEWEVDGITQPGFSFSGQLDTAGGTNPNDTLLNIGSISFPTGAFRNVKVWTSLPNGVSDTTNADDTIRFTVKPLLNGTYTIGHTGADFSSLTEAVTSMQNGICGPVVLNYLPSNQAYNEQVNIPAISGASDINTITINGNGNTLEYSTSSANRYLLRLQGARYITVNELVLRSLNATYGWGVHFYQGADSNTINGCTIDMSGVTSTTANNSGGIVFSGSTSTINNASANGKGNTISNNLIKGGASGGLYYGIVLVPSSSSSTPTYNRIINNTIQDFYAYGIYAQHTNGTLIKGNIITNTAKTANNTDVYGIAMITSSRLDTLTENQISNPFGATTTSTGTFYGIHLTSTTTNTPSGSENLVTNNLITNVRSEGTQYGISCQPGANTRIYHNTIALEHASTTSGSVTRGFYHTTGQGIVFQNNLVSITRGGSGSKHLLYFTTDTSIVCNYNGLYISAAASHHVGYRSATNRTSLTDWSTATGFDQQSAFDNPLFAYAPAGNFEPQSIGLNDAGTYLLNVVPTDIRQGYRSGTPDPGAFEFTPTGCLTPTNLSVSAIGSYSATVSWTAPSPAPNSGYEYVVSLSNTIPAIPGTPVSTTSDQPAGLNPLSEYYLFVRSVCNGIPGTWAGPVKFTTLCAPLAGGTYTIGGPTPDFLDFTSLANRLNCGSGIAGPVVINVAPNSGPYNERVIFTNIPGASAINTVVINGNGNTIQYTGSSSVRSVVRLEGVQYLTLDSLVIKTQHTTYGWGIHVLQSAMYNVIKRCVIDIGSVTSTGSNNSAGIVFSNSETTLITAGSNGSYNTIDGNTILGNPTGSGMYHGIVLVPALSASGYTGNTITNNTIRNFYATGIYGAMSYGSLVKNNLIENTTKTNTASSVYGISWNTGYRGDSITGNEIRNLAGSVAAYSGTLYGISLSNSTSSSVLTPVSNPMYITNNIVHTIKSDGGQYGIYSSNATNARYHHNTIVLDDATASSAFTRAFYHTGNTSGNGITSSNNMLFVTRTGTGSKHAVYLNTAGSYHFNNNAYWVAGGETGYLAGTAFATLSAWQSGANTDIQSRFANPQFVSASTGNLVPANGMISNMGEDLRTVVPADRNGGVRDSMPDPGAYEFVPVLTTDAGVYEIVLPPALPVGLVTPAVRLFNAGSSALLSVQVNWEVNGAPQPPVYFTGNLNTGALSTPVSLSAYNFQSGVGYSIKAWTSIPNGGADGQPANDSAALANLYTALPGGNYTINSNAGASPTNFTSFATFQQAVENYGISGAVDVKVIDTLIQSPLEFLKPIPGSSGTNTITFRGNDTAVTVLSSTTPVTLTLKAVQHLVFRDMTIESLTGTAVWITKNADSNAIVHCNISMPVLATSQTGLCGISVTGSAASPNAYDNNANYLLIDSCHIKGGYYGVLFAGTEALHARSNIIRNCTLDSLYGDAIRAVYQAGFVLKKSVFRAIGNGLNAFPHGIYITDGSDGHQIVQNTFTGSLGGCAIRSISNTAVDKRNLVANNMIQIGSGPNISLAMQIVFTENNDIVYNSVHITSTDVNSSCLNFSGSGVSNRVVNNIFKNTNQGSLFSITAPGLTLDNNCYYHNNVSNFPYVLSGTSLANFAQLQAAGSNDVSSLETDPLFVSATNLHTNNPLLNAKAQVFPSVSVDINDTLRDALTPDIGANEFSLPPREDAGVVAVTSPFAPVIPGQQTDVYVVIRNHGVGALTSAMVYYQDGFNSHNQLYTGSLAEGATDTVKFTGASAFAVPTSGAFSITAWTASPNGVADTDASNDSLTADFCQPMSGTYTINASGSGANNFTSFNEAITAITCGGVGAPVVFEVANGTYNEQMVIPGIPGASASRTVTFRSASGVRSNVQLQYTATHDTNNYVVLFSGARYVTFSGMSLANQGTGYSRVVSFGANNGIACEYITVRNCDLTGAVASANSVNTALVYGGSDDNSNLAINNNTITNGSMGVYVSGLPAKNQYSQGLTIDSNTFVNNAYNGISVSSRNGVNINRNTITSTSATFANGIGTFSTAGNVRISQNAIIIDRGNGIQCYQNAYYNEPGFAYVTSNAIHATNTGNVNMQGIRLAGGSKVAVYNNTVKLEGTNTTTSNTGVYIEGDITYANLQNTTSYDFRVVNNIICTENGYPLCAAELWSFPGNNVSRQAISQIDNNLYYNRSGANVAKLVATDYVKTNFAAFKGAVRTNSDSISRYLDVPFTPGSLKPLESDTLAWWINGRAFHLAEVTNEVTWGTRATVPVEGVPDIGAYEITPSVLPPLAVAIPETPAAGITQAFLFMGDTVAKIHWSPFYTAPDSVKVRQFVGERPPGVQSNQKYMNVYVSVDVPNGFYLYDVEMRYNDAWTGTMTVEPDIYMIVRSDLGYWGVVANGSLNMVDNWLRGNANTTYSGLFTGTDAQQPLPVKLASFTASKDGDAVLTQWKTASEYNVSHFILQRSEDAAHFEDAGRVPAVNRPSSYRFTDPLTGVNRPRYIYYRLVTVNRDGSRDVSHAIRVELNSQAVATAVLAPNPVSDRLTILLGNMPATPVQVTIYTMQGERVSEVTYEASDRLSQDVSPLEAGLYVMKITSEGTEQLIRFVKQ